MFFVVNKKDFNAADCNQCSALSQAAFPFATSFCFKGLKYESIQRIKGDNSLARFVFSLYIVRRSFWSKAQLAIQGLSSSWLQGASKKTEFKRNQLWERRRAHFQRLNSNSRVASDHQIVIVIIIIKLILMKKTAIFNSNLKSHF